MLVEGVESPIKELKALEVSRVHARAMLVLKFDLEKALAKDGEANNLNWGRPSEQGRGSTPPLFRKWPWFVRASTVHKGVVRTRLEDLAWLTFMSEVSLFASTSFFSPADAPVFDAYTKAVVQG
ncbi:hypothetical protein B296_00004778 [Ensete ventricosum]|uniref:Uncharacterized protein n=1 Tax=Ensete ventricosum TaxID=4639 RepID=A0A427BB72_ENSVE|nr:hypothetical protein B296_00004778 [Ensete ventricosum]